MKIKNPVIIEQEIDAFVGYLHVIGEGIKNINDPKKQMEEVE